MVVSGRPLKPGDLVEDDAFSVQRLHLLVGQRLLRPVTASGSATPKKQTGAAPAPPPAKPAPKRVTPAPIAGKSG